MTPASPEKERTLDASSKAASAAIPYQKPKI